MSARQRVMRVCSAHAEAAAGVGDHHRVLAVGEQMRARAERMRRRQPSAQRPIGLSHDRRLRHFVSVRFQQRNRHRHAFLQQQFRGAGHRLAMKAARHAVVHQAVRQRR